MANGKPGRPSLYTPELAQSKGAAGVEIYGLIDPRSGLIRYIGKANNSISRLKSHIRDSRTRNTPVYAWIRKLASLGFEPDIIVLSACRESEWEYEERRLIASGRRWGIGLLNLADGGDQPRCTPEQRASSANWKKMHTHPNTIAQRKINGAVLNSPERPLPLKKDGSQYTRVDLIRHAHEWIWRFATKQGNHRMADKVLMRMAEHHRKDPSTFHFWGG